MAVHFAWHHGPRDEHSNLCALAPSRPRGKQAETQIVSGSERGRGRRWKALSAGFGWSPPTICRVPAGAQSPGTSGRQGHCVGITHSGREATGDLVKTPSPLLTLLEPSKQEIQHSLLFQSIEHNESCDHGETHLTHGCVLLFRGRCLKAHGTQNSNFCSAICFLALVS